MAASDYPMFAPPDGIASKDHFEWTASDARLYFDWLMGEAPGRVESLLRFLAESRTPSVTLVRRMSTKLKALLVEQDFGTIEAAGTQPSLTTKGYAICADAGLLVAEQVIAACPHVHWKILKARKRWSSKNLPVLVGFSVGYIDPIEASIGNAWRVLGGDRSEHPWQEMLDSCVDQAGGIGPQQ